MVQSVPIKPLPLLILHLDQGEKYYAEKTIDFRGLPFIAKVISFGQVERTIPYPTGLISTSDAVVTVEDTDGQIRAWFDDRTPIKRIGELAFEFEANAVVSGNVDLPIDDPDNQDSQQEYTYRPFFTGEIIPPISTEPGSVTFTLRDITGSWLGRNIPLLGIRDNFPNMPDDVESIFIPVIMGRCYSKSDTGLEPQGVIDCKLIDTTLHRYAVARHQCFSIPTVYRKKPHDARFFVVSASEYTITVSAVIINGINYNMTFLDFAAQQDDGTEIHADVSGINYRWDFDTEAIVNGVEVRDFVDSIVSLIYLVLQDEVEIERFDSSSFLETRERTQARGYLCDGAITEQITNGLALSRLCGDAVIDLYQTNRGIINLHLYDAALDAESVVPLDDDLILKKSLTPGLPKFDKLFNRIRYRYYRQNAPLSEFRRSANTGQWGSEYSVDYIPDQEELAAVGTNPSLETQVELYFIRDDDTAKQVIKDRLSYYNLRSYTTDLELSGPIAIDYISLSGIIAVTEIWGIGPNHASPSAGWIDKVCKVYGITFDLSTLVASLSAVVPVIIDDADLDWSIDASHPAHDVQVRQPHLGTTINGTLDPSDPTRIYPDSDQTLDLQDSISEIVTVGLSFPQIDTPIITNFSGDGPSAGIPTPESTVVSSRVGWAGIVWIEDPTTKPRSAKGYVPIPNFDASQSAYVGTLDPNTKPVGYEPTLHPSGLREYQAGKATFYAKDFDHTYMWIGRTNPLSFPTLPGETFDSSEGEYDGNTTGWRAVDGYSRGQVAMFFIAPVSPGWALCDGSTVDVSTVNGLTNTIALDDLTGGDRFVRLGATSSLAAAVAPTISGGSLSGGVTDEASNHQHDLDNGIAYTTSADVFDGGGEPKDAGHIHSLVGGGTGLAGDHDHGGLTYGGGDHNHTGTTGSEYAHTHYIDHEHNFTHGHGSPVSQTGDSSAGSITGTISTDGEHTHAIITEDGGGEHQHAISTDGGFAFSDLGIEAQITTPFSVVNCTNATLGGNSVISASSGWGSTSGAIDVFGDGIIDHNHGGATNAGVDDGAHNHTLVFEDGADGIHTHSFTGGSLGVHHHGIDLDVSVISLGNVDEPEVPSGPGSSHNHSISDSGDHSHNVAADGNHTHSLTGSVANNGAHRHAFELAGLTEAAGSHSHAVIAALTGITAGTNGVPKSVILLPYFRL